MNKLDSNNGEIICQNCGWEWNVKNGGDDLYVCHKCYTDNSKFYLDNDENFSNVVPPELIVAGVTALTQFGSSIAQSSATKKANELAITKEIETICGKRRGFKKKKAKYDACASPIYAKYKANIDTQKNIENQQLRIATTKEENAKKSKRNTIIGVVVLAVLIGVVIYFKKK